jgi:hypothetical protein
MKVQKHIVKGFFPVERVAITFVAGGLAILVVTTFLILLATSRVLAVS